MPIEMCKKAYNCNSFRVVVVLPKLISRHRATMGMIFEDAPSTGYYVFKTVEGR